MALLAVWTPAPVRWAVKAARSARPRPQGVPCFGCGGRQALLPQLVTGWERGGSWRSCFYRTGEAPPQACAGGQRRRSGVSATFLRSILTPWPSGAVPAGGLDIPSGAGSAWREALLPRGPWLASWRAHSPAHGALLGPRPWGPQGRSRSYSREWDQGPAREEKPSHSGAEPGEADLESEEGGAWGGPQAEAEGPWGEAGPGEGQFPPEGAPEKALEWVPWSRLAANTVSIIGYVDFVGPLQHTRAGVPRVDLIVRRKRAQRRQAGAQSQVGYDSFSVQLWGEQAQAAASGGIAPNQRLNVQGSLYIDKFPGPGGSEVTQVRISTSFVARVLSREQEQALRDQQNPSDAAASSFSAEAADPGRDGHPSSSPGSVPGVGMPLGPPSAAGIPVYAEWEEESHQAQEGLQPRSAPGLGRVSGGQHQEDRGQSWTRQARSQELQGAGEQGQGYVAGGKGGSRTTTTSSNEDLWAELFENPDAFWDNRERKTNPRAPDFKHKASGNALWIDSRNTPAWVLQRLQPRLDEHGGGA